MLKSLSHSKHSPVPSPRFHYSPSSQSTPPSPSSRRSSKSTPQVSAPITKPVQYVDSATQWSPRINVKQTIVSGNLGMASETSVAPAAPVVVAAPLPLQVQPSSVVDSPSIKRRKSLREYTSTSDDSQTAQPKRVKPERTAVKILPLKYELCEVEDMVILIADMISELIQTNDSLPLRTGVLTRFHSRTPPGISVIDYLQRLAKHATITPPLLLSMVYYIDRLCSLYPAFTINTLTVHRFLITAATVAAKGLSDSFWNNATYARVGGIKIAELGLLELDFLYRVDWKIVPNPEILVDYYKGLVERSDGYELEEPENRTTEKDNELEDASHSKRGPAIKSDAETDTKWKAWMNDVSTKKSDGEDMTRNHEIVVKNEES